ncbi:unnamed protein product [Ilex paraguariensis]|uniref:Two-component response regulator-like APRR2 n=1 Tax=Ilex paraguariensis TaxID=185542 RepID=A0ABC8TV53_9AQUA
MVCTANDLLGWKDFPKGLRVLLLDEDSSSAAELRSKLEEMDYIVSTFYSENEALSAITSQSESFHVAIVEVSTDNSDGRLKFLESAKDLPTIMTSNIHCLSTMMKCIALGAVEFLRKPLSEDKLKNIWQHVVRKAFNHGEKDLSESLKPVKESVVSMLQLQLENEGSKNRISAVPEHVIAVQESNQELSASSDKYPAPSTPQLKQGVRLLDDGDCLDQINFSTEKESEDQDGECKSVEITSSNLVAETTVHMSPCQRVEEAAVKKEDESVDGFKGDGCPQSKDCVSNFGGAVEDSNKTSGPHNSSETKANRKKMKVDWTPELHKKFVQAVEQLGVDQAIPSRILELMKVEGLTRHNVASHLQMFNSSWKKYRMNRRRILPKEDVRRCPQLKDSLQRGYYPHKGAIALPPYHSTHTLSPGHIYPAWGAPSNYQGGVQIWGSPFYPAWQATDSWHWRPCPAGVQADAWGCPVMPPHYSHYTSHLQDADGFQSTERMQNSWRMPMNSFDLHPAEEVIDQVVKEAISKPWLPLPLGLKSPSTECVLTELSRQGISTIPPQIKGRSHHS